MLAALVAPVADWHHGHSSGSGGSEVYGGPEVFGVFVFSCLLLFAGSVVVGCAGGPIVLVLTRKARQLFWAIPGANLVIYLVVLLARPYLGGFAAQFRPPGLVYTVIEVVLLLLVSLVLSAVLALGLTAIRVLRRLSGAGPGWRREKVGGV